MQYKLQTQFQANADQQVQTPISVGTGVIEEDYVVTPAGTNVHKVIGITQNTIVACLLIFNATGSTNGKIGGSCTLKTNSSGSPQDTITLVDGIPVIFFKGTTPGGTAFTIGAVPFSGNITDFYMTDGSTGSVGGTLSVHCLTNQ